jgi:hypothetical protein
MERFNSATSGMRAVDIYCLIVDTFGRVVANDWKDGEGTLLVKCVTEGK